MLVSAIFGIAGGVMHSSLPIVAGVLPLAYLYMIGRRLTAYIDDNRIRYQSWLNASEAKLEHVVSVTRGVDLPYPRNRYFGPSSYEVRTNTGRFMVNLLYFSQDFARAFTDTAKRRGVMRRAI
jgi:hypothetical protein